MKPKVLGEYRLNVSTRPRAPRAGRNFRLDFVVSNPQTGAVVKRFVLNHERLFHLFIVSQDMSEYQHIHPQLNRDGSFTVETILPREAQYRLHADFFPVDGTPQVIQRRIAMAIKHADGTAADSPASLEPDGVFTKTVEGLNVKLELESSVAGRFYQLKYHLTDARTGAPVNDLEPYLGAWGHTLILNADQSTYLHSHPSEMLPSGYDSSVRGGPNVEFGVMFPSAGNYRIWTQFQRSGKIITSSFTVRVLPESPKS